MKALIVTPVFYPAIGGIEQHAYNLAKELSKKKIKVDVLTTEIGEKKFREKASIEGFNLFRVKTGLKNNSDLAIKGNRMILPLMKKALSLAKKEKYDLLHAHCPFTLAACIPAKFYCKIPLIATVHGNWINCVKGRRYFEGRVCGKEDYSNAKRCAKCLHKGMHEIKLKQFLLKSLAEKCDMLIAVSSDVKNSIRLGKIPIKVIQNVGSYESSAGRKKSGKKLKKEKNKKIILFVGSLIEEKGAMVLLEALPKIAEAFPETEVNLVYAFEDKKYSQKVKDFVASNDLGSFVFFYKNIPNKIVKRNFLPSADMVVLPSLWPEPCSTVATEAMNANVLVIASNRGGFPDLIKNNVTGILFGPSNSSGLAKKIIYLLKNEKKAKKLTSSATKAVEKELNWKKISGRVLEAYKGAAKKHR